MAHMNAKSPRVLIAIALIALIFGGGSYVLGWSSLLTVRSIEIVGAPTKESEITVNRSLGLEIGEKLARVDPRSISTRLSSNGWVQSSKISRNWLNGKVEISITPRVPVALYTAPGQPQVALDASGKTFNSPAELSKELPSVSASSIASGLAAIKVFTELPKEFSDGIDRLSAARPTNLLIYGVFSGRDLRIIWGDGLDTQLKIKVINALLEQPENKSIRMIDVTAPHAPIVK
jgi:cell division septal protein FtsQ